MSRRNRNRNHKKPKNEFNAHNRINHSKAKFSNKIIPLPEEYIKNVTLNGTVLWKMSKDGVSTKH